MTGLGPRRPHAAEGDADDVFAVDRHAVDRVERVGQAQAGHVVVAGNACDVAHPPAVGAQTRQRRLERRRAEERRPRDAFGRR